MIYESRAKKSASVADDIALLNPHIARSEILNDKRATLNSDGSVHSWDLTGKLNHRALTFII